MSKKKWSRIIEKKRNEGKQNQRNMLHIGIIGLPKQKLIAVFRNYVFSILVGLWGGGRQTDPLPWAPKDLATALHSS